MFCEKHNAAGLGRATCLVCELENQIESIKYAAHMPEFWKHGLAQWVNRLHECFTGENISTHIDDRVNSGSLVFPISPANKELGKLRSACAGLVNYRQRAGALNFQLEKADDYLRDLARLIGVTMIDGA